MIPQAKSQPMTDRIVATDSNTALPLDHGQETWDVLAARIESLVKRWETAESVRARSPSG